jgi:hypothetical protein
MKTLIALGLFAVVIAANGQESPKVYLTSKSAGNTWNAIRDQSQEMAKDFAKECREVQVTTSQQDADYAVGLNHIEVGLLVRDNQIAVTDTFGNVLSTKEGRSIKGGVKGACALILADWSSPTDARQRLVKGINAEFQRGGIVGYAEISEDKFTVHSERASAMRFQMILASRQIPMVRRAGIATYVYTNDADQNYVYDVKTSQIVASSAHAQEAQVSK